MCPLKKLNPHYWYRRFSTRALTFLKLFPMGAGKGTEDKGRAVFQFSKLLMPALVAAAAYEELSWDTWVID